MRVRYYKNFALADVWYGEVKTMPRADREVLLRDIDRRGMMHPLVAEWSEKRGMLEIAVGRNRYWCLRRLGETHAPVIVVAPEGPILPIADICVYTSIDALNMLSKVHPGSNSWRGCRSLQEFCDE